MIYQNLAEQSKYANIYQNVFLLYQDIFCTALYCPGLNRKQLIFYEKIVRLYGVLVVSTAFSVVFLEVPASRGDFKSLFFAVYRAYNRGGPV